MENNGEQVVQSATKTEPRAIKPEEEDEEEEDLFEINLEIFNKIPPPEYCWESYFTATTTSNTLLANCLLPIADVSSAVPMVMRACDALLSTREDQSSAASFVMMSQYKEMEV